MDRSRKSIQRRGTKQRFPEQKTNELNECGGEVLYFTKICMKNGYRQVKRRVVEGKATIHVAWKVQGDGLQKDVEVLSGVLYYKHAGAVEVVEKAI